MFLKSLFTNPTLYLLPLPVVTAFLPPLFIVEYSFQDYFMDQEKVLYLFLVWFGAEAMSNAIFTSEISEKLGIQTEKKKLCYWSMMLPLSLGLVVYGSSFDYLP